ncbi:MAG: hypothetical protein ABIJ09_11755 [Pseudomonadota bacterium]
MSTAIKSCTLLSILVLALAITACPQGQYTVAGTVTAAADGAALAGIKVSCQVEGGVAQEVFTAGVPSDDAGSADAGSEDADILAPGAFRCSAPASGNAATASVTVSFEDVDGAEQGGDFAAAEATVEVSLDGEATLDQVLELKP